MSKKESIINHLNKDYTEPIRDPLWQNIYLSPALKEISCKESFQKLGKIKQLGPAYHVYPGAVHTRLNHSLGVFHLAKRIILTLLSFEECSTLTLEGVKAFLCAAMLHDLGHFPFAHSLKELSLKSHEKLTAEMILSTPINKTIKNILKTDPYTVAAIVDNSLPIENTEGVSFYRNILSGVLDPDKLDYLNRDAYFCGVPYGIQDTDFVISKMKPQKKAGIVLQSQGLSAVENILFSKYLMYKTVYWHKTVRIATAMIRKAVFCGLRDSIISEHDLYGLDDDQFFSKYSSHQYPPFNLVKRVSVRNLYKMVYETDFNKELPFYNKLIGQENRAAAEAVIARRLSRKTGALVPEEAVIIDIPEPISFEIDLPIETDRSLLPFSQSGSVFTPPVIEGFSRTLRKLRIVTTPELALKIKDPKEMLEWII